MFSAAKYDEEKNWITSIGIQDYPIMDQYIYSFYFSCTTMLTIGYGDITPKNPREVKIVILLQIVGRYKCYIGVISFGYLINEMGHTLSKMRQNTE